MLARGISALKARRPARARLAAALAGFALVIGPATLGQPIGNGAPGQWNPAPCNGHGHTQFGRCFCDPGWAGAECATTEKALDCGDHGRASHGWCVCEPGWKGRACQTAPPTCAHGQVSLGKCICESGWSGDRCNDGPHP